MKGSLLNTAKPVAIIFGLIAILFIANPHAIADLASYSFDSGTYSHAYLIPFIMVYLLWHASRYGDIEFRWKPIFLIPLVVFLALFVLFQFAQIALISRALIPLIIFAAALTLFRISLGLIVPIALIWFITPVWGPLQPVLQQISVVAVTEIMSWTTIATYVEGNTVHIAVGAFEIAGGCSGLRYFITAMALSLMYTYLNFTKAKSIIIFFIIAAVGAMITNWIRIFAIILIGHYTNMESSMVEDHNTLGWYVFIPFILLLFYLGGKLERPVPLKEAEFTALSNKQWGQTAIPVLLIGLISTTGAMLVKHQSVNWSVNVVNIEAEPMTTSLPFPSPKVTEYASVSNPTPLLQRPGSVAYQFEFNGESSANRADYFFNQLVPESAQKQSHDRYGDFGIIQVTTRTKQNALIHYSYATPLGRTASEGAFMLLRLRAALMLDKRSTLNWQWIPCESDCSQEKAELIKD